MMIDLIFKNVDKELEQVINDCLQGKELVVTKWGNAKIYNTGYYAITSRKEGNFGKLLHRLVYEEYYGEIPESCHIHHINGNKIDNRIENLKYMENSAHNSLHMKGEKNPMYGQTPWNKGKTNVYSEETLQKMSKNISKVRNKTGYYRVSIHKTKNNKQGFIYEYRYYDENGKPKTISSVSIEKLEEKVKAKGLLWCKIGDMI